MNATDTMRTNRPWWLPMLAALAIGMLSAAEAGAAPVRNTGNTSIATRVKAFEEVCEKWGKGDLNVAYGYDEDGNVTSASADCEGGTYDGEVCTYTAEYTDCYEPLRHSGNPATQPKQVPVEDSALAQEPDSTDRAAPRAGQAIVVTGAQPATDLIVEDDEA